MKWNQYDGIRIKVKQQKTGVLVSVKCLPQLKVALDKLDKPSIYILVSESTGRPYNGSHFSKTFARIRDKIGIRKDLQFKDLRRTAVVSLARAGCATPEIASITGHERYWRCIFQKMNKLQIVVLQSLESTRNFEQFFLNSKKIL